MKTRFLFPNWLKPIGWILLLPGFVLGYMAIYKDYKIPGSGISVWPRSPFFNGTVYQDLTKTLVLLLIIVGLFLVAFSKEKKEDELTARMRQNALYWSVLISYLAYLTWLLATITMELFQLDKKPFGGFAETLRLESMQLAVYVNYAFLMFANFLFFFTDFMGVMFFNLGTTAFFFLLRFNYILWKYNNDHLKGNLAI